jgi:hypothetical protein
MNCKKFAADEERSSLTGNRCRVIGVASI